MERIIFKLNRPSYWSSEVITLLCSVLFTVAYNGSFWGELLRNKEILEVHTLLFIFYTGTAVTGLQWFLLLLVINRWTFRWFVALLFLITSFAVYFMSVFHIYIDPAMMTNVFSTDYQESKEFLQWRIVPYFLFLGLLPTWIIWNMRIYKRSLPSYWVGRLSTIFLSLLMFFAGGWAAYTDLSTIHREHKEIVYLVTPFNLFSSSIKAYWREYQPKQALFVIGKDAQKQPRTAGEKPRVLVLVIGETVRAANWGLNGYHRQTTPRLAKHQLINFDHVTSCGTSTAVSLPCMFSSYGQHHYNEQKIRQSESLLHLLYRAQVSVLWRDNQSGCKGVCDGLSFEQLQLEAFCSNGRCFDEILLHQLKERIAAKKEDQIIVLHMLGNHGPAYFQRYPVQYKRWQPTCNTADLSSCSQQAIINTYDNAILYTDSVLAHALDALKTVTTHNTALIYVSDHGESLGEHNLFLHGLPYFIAPDEQKMVPMFVWMSRGLSQQLRLNEECLRDKKADSLSHDYLFSSILSLFDIKTKDYDPAYDLFHSCRANIS